MAYPEYQNIELYQGENFEMTVDFSGDSSYSMLGSSNTPKVYKAFLVDEYSTASASRTAITVSDINTGEKTLKLSMAQDLTQALADDFDGYWDIMEKDVDETPDKFTRLLQGEAKVFPQITLDDDF